MTENRACERCTDVALLLRQALHVLQNKSGVIGNFGESIGAHEWCLRARKWLKDSETTQALTRAKVIQDCIFALCPYCKASADTGQTTEHRCPAKPLFKLMYGE